MGYKDLVLKYKLKGDDNERKIYLGTVTSISETFTKSVSVFPLVSLSQNDAFGLENGNGQAFSIQFKHVANEESELEDGMNAAQWYQKLTEFIDRWQTRSDGFTLEYNPTPSDNPSIQSFKLNGYIKSLSRTYNAGNLLEVDCDMRFDVGTMYVKANHLIPLGWGDTVGN